MDSGGLPPEPSDVLAAGGVEAEAAPEADAAVGAGTAAGAEIAEEGEAPPPPQAPLQAPPSGGDMLAVAGEAPQEAPPQAPPPPLSGGGVLVVAGEEFEEVQDFSSEPLESRFESKDLNRRCSAYTEAAAKMAEDLPEEPPSEPEACFALFRSHIDACLGESLPKGQDAALNALTVYLEKCPGLESEDSEVRGLVRRLIEHKSIDKPKMQQLAPGIVVLVAEICECPGTVKDIVDCLGELEGAKKKTQGFLKKQIAFTIKLIYHLIAEFGLPCMSPKLGYLPAVLKYLADSDRGIREACYSVVLELAAWMGDLPDAAKSLEEPQKKELSKRLSAQSEEERTRTEARRRYRSQVEAVGAQPSAFDRVETIDALKKLPKGWCIDKVFSFEKWKEKQQYLQILSAAVDTKRLGFSEGYAALVPALQRLLKTESNIPVVIEAAKCAGLIAKGLRGEFDRPARQLLTAALSRIIDKSVWKPNILIDKIEQLLWAVPVEVFFEELRQYMNSKSTWAKKEAMSLILRTLDLPPVQESCPDAAQRFFPMLAASVLPNADDSDNGVRHEACKFLAVLVHRNLASPDLGPAVLERFPMNRQSGFEEEWRKLGVEEPCPLATFAAEDRSRAASNTSSLASRRAGGETTTRSRPTSPLQHRSGSPLQVRPESPRPGQDRQVPESPSKMRQPVASKAGAGGRGSAPLRSRSADASQLDEQSILESSIVKDMAQEIASLRAQLQRAEESAAAAAAAPLPARPESRMRQPAEGRGAGQPRAAAAQQRAAGGGAVTPRYVTPAPVRAQSAGRAEDYEAAQPERRLSGPGSAGCATPRPSQRSAAASAASGRISAPRASSGEARISREGSSTALRRENSANALGPGAGFKIEPPKVAKQARQQRERCQHWGPEPIAAEHLTAMKESWKGCVNDRLYRCMFSDRMEEQLLSLQTWKYQVTENMETVVEVLDMLLKWLTWMLFNTNTQIWKLTLEVFSSLLDRLAAADVQLTEREAYILATNILERSGHNIQSVRENMLSILRQIIPVYPRIKLLPLILLALASKNKRSVACAMRLLGDALDRQVASTLARSQKDLGVVFKMIDEKDPDVRRAAVQAAAALSQHLDPATFERIVSSLPKSTQPIIRSAASRLPPGSSMEDSKLSVLEDKPMREPSEVQGTSASYRPSRTAGAESPTPPLLRRSGSGTSTGLGSPSKIPSPGKALSRMPSPKQIRPQAAEVSAAPASQHQRPAEKVSHSSSPSSESSQVASSVERLVQCGGEDFRMLCATLKQRVRQLTEGDAIALAEALVHSMRMYFGHDGCADRCTPLVELLDEFCASKECLRPLPTSLLKGMLKEQLRNLQYSSWTKHLENGTTILRTLNLSCVMLLSGINRSIAYSLLLDLGTDESEAVHSSLVVKCLRKLNKSLGTSRNIEVEVQSTLDVVKQWLQRVHPRLAQAEGREKGMVETAAASLMEGVKEMVEAARNASAAAARSWADRHEGCGEEASILREWALNGTGGQVEKENRPSSGGGGAAPHGNALGPGGASPGKDGGSPPPPKRRISSPAKLMGQGLQGSPCTSRNGLA